MLFFCESGILTDHEGEPLIGVNIQVKDSDKGTATDFDGKFSLEDISENAVLIVSYVGYQTQEVVVAGKTNLRSEEHTSELQSRGHLVCRLLLEKKKNQ